MRTVLFALLVALAPLTAHAITIDEFDGQQSAAISPGQGPGTSVVGLNSCIGGTRSLEVNLSAGGNPFERLLTTVFSGFLSHSQESSIAGTSVLAWDADMSPALFDAGLGGIDLTQDGATAFEIQVVNYDAPNNLPLPLFLRVYDASDPFKVSQGSVILNSAISTGPGQIPPSVFIPFVSLQGVGANGAADLTTVGAIQFVVDGGATIAADLQLDWIGTNGLCKLVPNAQGRVIDQCGVCGGDNSTCLDCAGIPNGSATEDRCGVCNGDGNSCLECQNQDLSPKQAALDGGAKNQEKQIKYLAKLLLKHKPTKTNKTWVKTTLSKVHELQVRNWILSWTLPSDSVVCGNQIFCSSVSNQWIIDEYQGHNDELLAIANEFFARIKKSNKQAGKTAANYMKKVKKQHADNYALSLQVPATQSSCS
jgi:hypothetical protein